MANSGGFYSSTKADAEAVNTEKKPRGRPPKYPPDEVRRRLMDAAIERLRLSGVESGLDSVTLDGAIIDADVPRGMSYKIWRVGDETPQDAFRRATVLDLLSIPAVAGLPMTREFTLSEIDRSRDAINSDDDATRKSAVIDLLRRVGEFNHLALVESEHWKLYVALRAAAITRPLAQPEVMAALNDGEEFLISAYSDFYSEVASTLHLKLRSEFEMHQFSAAAYSLNEGLAMRLLPSYRQSGVERADGGEPWTLFALALEGLIFRFFDWA